MSRTSYPSVISYILLKNYSDKGNDLHSGEDQQAVFKITAHKALMSRTRDAEVTL